MKEIKIKSYRDLIVWQKSISLSTRIYEITAAYPASEQFGLTSQTRRSSVSVGANIAEGYGRNSTQDYIRFLNIACGSLFELQTLMIIARNLKLLDDKKYTEMDKETREIERMLCSLIQKLSSKQP